MERIKAEFSELVADELFRVEDLMRQQVIEIHPNLDYAIDHLLTAGGKRIRPTLTLLTGRMLNADPEKNLTLAAAIEMLHTATLVHDDLIDGATLRRGKPTLNTQWPTGATVLTGDYVFARAARLAADTGSLELMKLFAQKLMIMVNGEISQLFGTNAKDLRKGYFDRIYAKTASLFEIASFGPALLSDCDESMKSEMKSFGFEIGIAFQIVDDVFDFMGDEDLLGKPVASDLRQGLITLPSLLYYEANPDDRSLPEILKSKDVSEDELENVILKIRESGVLQGALEEAKEFTVSAKSRLTAIENTSNREALMGLADYIIERPF
jgi:geranylgeranyl pyrophosphate synthase